MSLSDASEDPLSIDEETLAKYNSSSYLLIILLDFLPSFFIFFLLNLS